MCVVGDIKEYTILIVTLAISVHVTFYITHNQYRTLGYAEYEVTN